jgi:periplasmic copper chaperone A
MSSFPRNNGMRLACRAAIVAGLAMLSIPARADGAKLGYLVIDHAWIRLPPAGAAVAGGYLTIANAGAAADRLVAVSSPIAGKVQLHRMAMSNGVMTMEELKDGIEIPAGATVELAPGSLHIMFMGLKRPLAADETVPGELSFEKAGTVAIGFAVLPMGATGATEGGQ